MTAKRIHPPRRAAIFINKLEAARRQLDAAIRMTFSNEDELAIHTIAAAAYRILRDLLEKRGRFDFDELLSVSVYHTAHSLASGELSEAELDELTSEAPQLRDLLVAVADDMQAKSDAVTPDKFSVRVKSSARVSDWNRLSATANFLKHADKDADTHLSLDNINNDELLMRACVSYVIIFRHPQDVLRERSVILHQTPEMSAFHIWWMSRHDPDQLRREYGSEFCDGFQRLSPSRRRRACFKLIRLFTRWRSEGHALPS